MSLLQTTFMKYHTPTRPSLEAQTVKTHLQCGRPGFNTWVGKITLCSILAWKIPMDRRAWQVSVHGVAKTDTTERQSTVEHKPTKNSPWKGLRCKQRHIVYTSWNVACKCACIDSTQNIIKMKNEERWGSEWDRYMSTYLAQGTVLQPEIHNKPKVTISVHEELRVQRK